MVLKLKTKLILTVLITNNYYQGPEVNQINTNQSNIPKTCYVLLVDTEFTKAANYPLYKKHFMAVANFCFLKDCMKLRSVYERPFFGTQYLICYPDMQLTVHSNLRRLAKTPSTTYSESPRQLPLSYLDEMIRYDYNAQVLGYVSHSGVAFQQFIRIINNSGPFHTCGSI